MWLPARPGRAASLAVIVTVAIVATACGSSNATSNSGSGGSGGTVTKSSIEVGLVTSLTSSSLAPFPQVATGQKAAIAYINSTGGINGQPLVANQCDGQEPA